MVDVEESSSGSSRLYIEEETTSREASAQTHENRSPSDRHSTTAKTSAQQPPLPRGSDADRPPPPQPATSEPQSLSMVWGSYTD